MVYADAEALCALFSDDYALKHIGDSQQTKEDCLRYVASGQMDYHNIVIEELTVSETAQLALTARTRTDTTIWAHIRCGICS